MSSIKYEFTIQEVVDRKKISFDELDKLKIWNSLVDLPILPDELLAIFLIACERNLENTKKAILAYTKFKKESRDLFQNRNIDEESLMLGLNTVYLLIMPVRTDDDCVVLFIRIKDPNYRNFDLDTFSKLLFILFESITNTKQGPPTGIKLMVDVKGSGLMHLSRFKIKTLRKMLQFVQDALPVHMTALHLINFGFIAEKIVLLMRPFINSHLFEVIHLHPGETDMDTFSEKFIPKKCLPREYGGFLPSLDEMKETTIESFRQLKQFFEDEHNLWQD